MSYIEICTTTDNEEVVSTIKDFLLTQKLSPCIQIIPNIDSSYVWNDKNVTSKEFLVKIKTTKKHKTKISTKIIHTKLNPLLILYFI